MKSPFLFNLLILFILALGGLAVIAHCSNYRSLIEVSTHRDRVTVQRTEYIPAADGGGGGQDVALLELNGLPVLCLGYEQRDSFVLARQKSWDGFSYEKWGIHANAFRFYKSRFTYALTALLIGFFTILLASAVWFWKYKGGGAGRSNPGPIF